MESLAAELAACSIVTVRFNFAYLEQKKKRPDPAPIAEKTVASMVQKTHELFPDYSVYVGGKSFGGRMTSQRMAKECPPFVKGIVFYGFPLHPVGQPSLERAAHLQHIRIPMLFLQGTRDKLADLVLLEKVCSGLPSSTLHIFEGADHSFKSGKQNLIPALAEHTRSWMEI
jgi:predicted alpha/beta-hydrolase family hydrolase